MNKKFAAFAMMGAMLSSGFDAPESLEPIRRKKPKEKTMPNGVKWFHFNRDGGLTEEKTSLTAFSCIARDEENARRKLFNSFKK